MSAFWRGDLASARHYLEGAIEAYDLSRRHEHLALYTQDPKAVCLVRLAWVDLWRETRPGRREGPICSRAGRRSRSSHDAVVHPHLRGDHRGRIRGSRPPLAELLGEAELLGKRLPLRYLMIVGEALRGWLDVCEGVPGGIERIVQSVSRSRTDQESLHLTYTLLLLARARSMAGGLQEGRAATREGLSLSLRHEGSSRERCDTSRCAGSAPGRGRRCGRSCCAWPPAWRVGLARLQADHLEACLLQAVGQVLH